MKNIEQKRLAFTMAEILLSLTIIGIVAAITLPSLTGNINERTWNTQRKALYARFSQAIALMPALNGYGTLEGSFNKDGTQTITADNVAETFISAGLSKVLKINNICNHENLEDCGIATKIITISGSAIDTGLPSTLGELNTQMISAYTSGSNSNGSWYFSHKALDTKVAAFETQNGESIAVYYNPTCQSSMNETLQYNVQPKVCANFIYDLNGSKGPNTMGKDIGIMAAVYPTDSVVVAPTPIEKDLESYEYANISGEICRNNDSETRIPTREELIAIFVNKKFLNVDGGAFYWTNSRIENRTWRLNFGNGRLQPVDTDGGEPEQYLGSKIRCVKR